MTGGSIRSGALRAGILWFLSLWAAVAWADPDRFKLRRDTTQGSPIKGQQLERRGLCDLNRAEQAELALLPGIGATRAKAIVAYRRKQPFRHISDLTKVKGIGRKTLARLLPYVAIRGGTSRVLMPRDTESPVEAREGILPKDAIPKESF